MGFLNHLFYPWGWLLTAIAIIHFIRRRPDTFWIYVILFLGPIGALVYLLVEALPDMGSFGQSSFRAFPRRKRIQELLGLVQHNPSPGNFEELGDLYMDDGKLPQARAAYHQAIASRADTSGPFYGRGVCNVLLGEPAAAIPDLEPIVTKEPDYDFHRAAGLLAHAYALTGQNERAEALFRQVTTLSTSSETYLNFASFLASQGRSAEARQWAQKVLDKKPAMPGYQRRRERSSFQTASKMLKKLPA